MAQLARASSKELFQPHPKKAPNLLQKIVRQRADYLYIAPAIFVMALIILYPMVETIRLAFFETPPTGAERFVGLDNFSDLLTLNLITTSTETNSNEALPPGYTSIGDITLGSSKIVVGATEPLFWLVAKNTLWWTLGSTFFSFLLGLAAALLIHTRLPGMRLISGILVIPYVIGQVTAAYGWRWMLHSDFGVISQTLMQLGLLKRPILFLSSTEWVIPSLVLVNTWKSFPFVMIMMLAGLQTIPEELYRAAKVDGANAWQRFWEITLPQLVPVITVTTVLSIIGNMNSFTIPYVMTGGGPAHQSEIIITWINNLSFQSLRFGYSAAVAVVLFLVLFVFSYFYVRALVNRGGSGQAL